MLVLQLKIVFLQILYQQIYQIPILIHLYE
jgi:hypothetical protein